MAPSTAELGRESVRLCVFAKPPGVAKTRLARDIGPDNSTRLAAAFLADTWRLVREIEWATPLLAVSEPSPELAAMCPGAEIWQQGGGDLGARLARVTARALRAASAVIVLGSDSPGLPRAILDDALGALMVADAVIGPATDGGFYLLGLRRPSRDVFIGVPWSTKDAGAVMRQRLVEHGMPPMSLATFFDVDCRADLCHLAALLNAGTVSAPATTRVIEALNLPGIEVAGTSTRR